METTLHELPGSVLRKLLISEVREFILLLDKGTLEELQQKEAYLNAIFAQLSEKEQEELGPLVLAASVGRLPKMAASFTG
jgi:hypothetical protein